MAHAPDFIPFNKPFIIGRELEFIARAVESGHLSGNGFFTKECERFFKEKYRAKKNILTTSCTDALEMASLLLKIEKDDEVIIPSYSFVSTANPFILRGAKIVFADSLSHHPNIDAESLEALITPRTKAIVCVHYAGMACDMEKLLEISAKKNIPIVEDAAHAIESKWKGEKQLGTIGQLGAFSFHETKNIIAGEGGLLCVNDDALVNRSEIISEKGTNRQSFFRGEIKKYEWTDIGSSFMPSELTAAFLFAQLQKIDQVQKSRIDSWNQYHAELEMAEKSGCIERPKIPDYAMSNGHIYYLVCKSVAEREKLIAKLESEGIQAVFHYQSLHKSPFFAIKHDGRPLPNADKYSECLVRLPMWYGMKPEQITRISSIVKAHFGVNS